MRVYLLLSLFGERSEIFLTSFPGSDFFFIFFFFSSEMACIRGLHAGVCFMFPFGISEGRIEQVCLLAISLL